MKFGVMDHVDVSGLLLHAHYEARLKLVEAYDRLGFHCYHMAEHHCTPLASAPTPGIFLSAVAQRTTRLRFGPLVYLLPFYHPVRLIEEICLLDQMSQGRFQLGIGKGVSPFEARHYGLDPATLQPMYEEALEILRRGLAGPVLDFEGEYYRFKTVPMTLQPYQKPHPPLWYGISSPQSTVWAAANRVNVCTLLPAGMARGLADRYAAEWAALGHAPGDQPLVGLIRNIVVAETDAEARAIASRAFQRWRTSFRQLWLDNGHAHHTETMMPADWAAYQAMGSGCAGSPATVRGFVERQIAESGVNYFVAFLMFGDMDPADALRSVELYGREVVATLGGVA